MSDNTQRILPIWPRVPRLAELNRALIERDLGYMLRDNDLTLWIVDNFTRHKGTYFVRLRPNANEEEVHRLIYEFGSEIDWQMLNASAAAS